MAGNCVKQERAVQEIEQLKSVAHCKIIKNVGDFTYLVKATIPDTDVQIKFQLTADYPQVKPTIFINHPTLKKDDMQKILSNLPEESSSLLVIFEAVQELLGSHGSTTELKEERKSSPNTTKRRKQKCRVDSDEKAASTKKPSMRTAADVIKRIQWDSSLQRDLFIVGYIDRFLGVQEQPFNAFNWVNPAEADWMDLNIPEHRIEYFKYADKIVWEKKSRLDNVFGSTGGTTIDQLLCEDGESGKDKPATGDSATGNNAENTVSSSDESDDDVQIIIGPTIIPPRARVIPQRKQYPTNTPNHFIAIPITNSAVMEAVSKIQDEYITLSESDGEQYQTELYNLHITLCSVRINRQDELDTVSEILYDLILDLGDKIQQTFTVGNLDTFWNRVLYAQATFNQDFHSFVIKLRSSLSSRGIKVFDEDNEFIPHLTILKFPQHVKELHFPIEDFISIKSESQAHVIGESMPLEQICLLSKERDDSNRYIQKLALDV